MTSGDTTTFFQSKGGQGATTAACVFAVLAARLVPRVRLVAHHIQDAAAVLGIPGVVDPGLEHLVSPNLTLASIDLEGTFEDRWTVPHTVRDVGIPGAGDELPAARTILVIRPCYLAIHRALAGHRAEGVLVVAEKGRSLTADDVTKVLGVPLVGEIEAGEGIARGVDSGLITKRVPHQFKRALESLLPADTLVEA